MQENFLKIIWVDDADLTDYPRDLEDITDTAELEDSMKQIKFCDPLDVTDFEMPEGKYMIISGRRRRAAAKKVGIFKFPVIVRHFESAQDIYNYVLLMNYYRDSMKDTLLYARRYRMHEEYLKESGFEGSIREEVAKRLGLSVQQADRYRQFNKVIQPVWEMVARKEVAVSSVVPMAPLSPEDQSCVVESMRSCLESGIKLTRKRVKAIVEAHQGKSIDQDDAAESVKRMVKHMEGVKKCLEEGCYFDDEGGAEKVLIYMGKTFESIIEQMSGIVDEYHLQETFQKLAAGWKEKISKYSP